MNWIKSHKIIVLLIVIIVFLLFRQSYSHLPSFSGMKSVEYSAPSLDLPSQVSNVRTTDLLEMETVSDSGSEYTSNSVNRIVVQTSNMSLLVKDVKESGDKIVNYAKENGGYKVKTRYSHPTESPFRNISIRIPTNKLDKALEYFRSLAIKVTNENIMGKDITEEYTNTEARLATLNKARAKLEDILNKATDVQDILDANRQTLNLQKEIDALVGQKKAMEENAKFSKITIYLSTDELALPYAPDNVFRPDVVFKYAVRSLLTTLTKIATAIIWIVVYSPLIILCILGYIFYKRWRKRRTSTSN